ncbi:MAG: GNAT family N-acetyltransferase [Ruminococcaceae bacterium]|nr:GNAT family N-acetyltransferase [Oscillospiraceae bacterium]
MKSIDISRFSTLYSLRALTEKDAEAVREIAKENPAFEKYGIEEICRDMHLLPPGKEMEEKYYLGYFEKEEMVGVLDFIDGYPEADTGYIGLFMLSKYEQGRKIGTSLIEALACYCRELGYKRLLLGYDKANPQAAGFWESLDFESVREIPQKDGIIVVAERSLVREERFKSFSRCLLEQCRLHPAMQPRDVLKMCYQAAFGAEHGLGDPAAARKYLRAEFSALRFRGHERLYEVISPELCRINLRAWRRRELKWQWLYNMFTAARGSGSIEEYFDAVDKHATAGELPFTIEAWKAEIAAWDGEAVSHSEAYRETEEPAYRIVPTKYINAIRVLEEMAEFKDGCVVAIDGRSNSGKSSLAKHLAEITGAGLVHMDDFLMPAGKGTVERLGLPGGNIAYDLFKSEVLSSIRSPKAFSHRYFNEHKIDFKKKKRVKASPYRIVEGSYSQHSYFGEYMDIKVFMTVDKTEQRMRVVERDGEALAPSYFGIWIPMEEEYFNFFRLNEKADVLIST